MPLHEVYVGVGSNLDGPLAQVLKAMELLKQKPYVFDLKISPVYQSKPLSDLLQPDYANAVCTFNTCLGPEDLLKELQAIEKVLGKEPKPKNAPRPIDLDLLFFDRSEIHTESLRLPHPRWTERLFVIRPLADLTAFVYLPGINEPFPLQSLLLKEYPGQELTLLHQVAL